VPDDFITAFRVLLADFRSCLDRLETRTERAELSPVTHAGLRGPHARIMKALNATPAISARITRLAGYSPGCDSYVRRLLADLVRWNMARHTPDGYVLE
jgi:hypothetical protein